MNLSDIFISCVVFCFILYIVFHLLQHVTIVWSVRLSVCMYVYHLSHSCTMLKTLDWIRCHLAGILGGPKWHCIRREGAPVPHGKERFEGSELPVCSDVICCQITLVLVVVVVVVVCCCCCRCRRRRRKPYITKPMVTWLKMSPVTNGDSLRLGVC